MLTKRIIACMDVRDGQVVKGVQFQQLRHAGDPAALARRYNVEGIDEVVVLDITATLESRQARAHTIAAVAKEIFLPLTVGGGIRTEADAAAAIDAGADKVSLNSAALADCNSNRGEPSMAAVTIPAIVISGPAPSSAAKGIIAVASVGTLLERFHRSHSITGHQTVSA
jgi:imidazoleglycerol phosphate synthase cyclase subunit